MKDMKLINRRGEGLKGRRGEKQTFFLLILFISLSPLLPFSLSFKVAAQTGGAYQIEKTVVASGGSRSTGTDFTLESTAGQTLAGGFLQSSGFTEYIGFWTPVLAPTAAGVTIGGRVLTADGQGIRNAQVMLTASSGESRFSSTGSFGYYRFNDVRVGETYVLTVYSKRFVFTNPTRIITVNEELNNLDFLAAEQ